jgi:hypothetical protein
MSKKDLGKEMFEAMGIKVVDCTPCGVPTADCIVCGRKGGHIMPIQDKSVKQYQEDIEVGVDVSGKSKELELHICRFNDGECSCSCFIKGQSAECQAWMKGERCHSCGKYMKPSATTNTCPRCWEEQ